MPTYRYFCSANQRTIDVHHSMREDVRTWRELCERALQPLGTTDPDAPVERILFPVGLAAPRGDAELKSMGFTKLVRREKGVYENVTALDGEKRYVTADDPGSIPDFKKRNLD
ncbi:MAG: zinc ribbon domain-containing protein [Myxococcales bacterium]|nr:zinc ribbon domain-containing protein [Myxococcales bacterium]